MKLRGVNLVLMAIGFALFLSVSISFSQNDQSYSRKPLSDPIRDVAKNLVEFMALNNWLNVNYESAPAERHQALKERLYSIIDSHVKHYFASKESLLPADSDFVLTQCFAWATTMGVYGAHSVLEKLNSNIADSLQVTAPIPTSFNLTVQGEMFDLSSAWGNWRVDFPYYFMVHKLLQYKANNDLQTQIASISTGFGKHSDNDGYSQSTIMIVYSPEGVSKTFDSFWLESFGLSPENSTDDSINGLSIYKKLDTSLSMHYELVFPKTTKGAMAVVFLGIPGTYQHNRPHFIDFLKHLELDKPD
ncbi:MAG: hypothetical protein IIA17_10555 [candidate division Zixibacteria bacterium]|nr:hypothetical protein [candidate division Zixibacteria bacterium]